MYRGCPTCSDKQTFNTMLNNTMGDLYRETERWIERVMTYGYMYSIMWECQLDKFCKTDVEVRGHVDSYSLADVLNTCDAMCGGRCETFDLHHQSTDRSVITYVGVQSLYPYVCKSKHYPVGHPRCLIGPNLRGLDVNSYEGLIKCKILPPRGLRIPLLPCHNQLWYLWSYAEQTLYHGYVGLCRVAENSSHRVRHRRNLRSVEL